LERGQAAAFERDEMVTRFDHVTVVVRDLDGARRFFVLLGFVAERSVVIAGEPFAAYMGVEDIEADHVTFALAGASPRVEVQLLHYRRPALHEGGDPADLARPGFNHVCFTVDDLDAEVARLQTQGVQLRNAVMQFHDRKLVFLEGPEGITIELAQWL
jgi:catechol 2,3-dioxygenase-like lactoylglutathione lyase family enzyme